jgi:4-oxalocrotonate tautomerase
MPTIRIEMWSGRSLDQKRQLARLVTQAVVEALKVQPDEVKIRIVESEKENYAVGGVLRSNE